MKWNRRNFLTLAASVALTVAACSPSQQAQDGTSTSSSNQSTPQNGEVNVYSSRHYDSDDVIYKRFTEETGIKVNLIEGDADELIERIKNEGANSPADVLVTVDAGRLWRAEEQGLFQPVDSEALTKAIPANLRHPEGLWFGMTQRARVVVYNKAAVQPSELTTYEALADPKWKGRVCIRSSGNVYNQSLLGSMVESDGAEKTEAWAKGLVANLAREPEGGDIDQIKAVAAGQCDVAIVNHYYWARLAKSDKPDDKAAAEATAVFFPNQGDRGTHVNISGAGIVVNAPHKENAVKFLEFLVTPEAQKIFADSNNEYPVLKGVEVDPVVAEMGNFKVDETNVAAYGRNNAEVVKIVDRSGWK
ncbi:MAG TPA: Fe(3+) ABC transporter substrate-binding protein [Leptolyngbyaceae cyanobacterium]